MEVQEEGIEIDEELVINFQNCITSLN